VGGGGNESFPLSSHIALYHPDQVPYAIALPQATLPQLQNNHYTHEKHEIVEWLLLKHEQHENTAQSPGLSATFPVLALPNAAAVQIEKWRGADALQKELTKNNLCNAEGEAQAQLREDFDLRGKKKQMTGSEAQIIKRKVADKPEKEPSNIFKATHAGTVQKQGRQIIAILLCVCGFVVYYRQSAEPYEECF